MPPNVLARMVTSEKLRIEDVPNGRINIKEGALPVTDKAMRPVKHVDQKQNIDPTLKTIGDI